MARPTTASGLWSVVWIIVMAAILLGAYIILRVYGR